MSSNLPLEKKGLPEKQGATAVSQVDPIAPGITVGTLIQNGDAQEAAISAEEVPKTYLRGWRLYILVFGLCASLLLSTLETTIVSTALVNITNSLKGFENKDWVVTSYLLTYTGFLVIYAKFSDIFGSKFMILLALFIFTGFSIACGAATGMTELIILRALQGLGASGIYSMVGVVLTAAVPQEEYGKYMGIMSSVFAISSILGPLLGGVITEKSTWRWVFLLNAPGGGIAIGLISFFLPSDYSAANTTIFKRLRSRFTRASFRRLDLTGVFFMLAGSILLVFALSEAGTRYPWGNAAIISSLVVAGLSFIAFVLWELWLERKKSIQEPIFPMRLAKNRVLAGVLFNAFLAGFPFVSLVVNIPQRLQASNGITPSRAGIALLPLLLMTPLASALTGLLGQNKYYPVPPLYLVLLGSCLQLVGVGLTSTLDSTGKVPPETYGYEILMGLGFGFLLTSLLGFIPLVVDKKDMPVMFGAVTQVRVLGGTIGLAISTVVLNSFMKRELAQKLSPEEIVAVSQSISAIEGLSVDLQAFVRDTFARGYQKLMRVTLGFSVLVLISALIMVERVPRRLDGKTKDKKEEG